MTFRGEFAKQTLLNSFLNPKIGVLSCESGAKPMQSAHANEVLGLAISVIYC